MGAIRREPTSACQERLLKFNLRRWTKNSYAFAPLLASGVGSNSGIFKFLLNSNQYAVKSFWGFPAKTSLAFTNISKSNKLNHQDSGFVSRKSMYLRLSCFMCIKILKVDVVIIIIKMSWTWKEESYQDSILYGECLFIAQNHSVQ